MTYTDKYGTTILRGAEERFQHLKVHWDYDYDENNLKERKVVLFYTPDINDIDKYGCPDHDHIELSREAAWKLKTWLDEFFKEVGDYDPSVE